MKKMKIPKKLLFLVLLLVASVSSFFLLKESYISLETSGYNQYLQGKSHIKDINDLVDFYFIFKQYDSIPHYEIIENILADGIYTITITYGTRDDSIRSEKLLFKATKNGADWKLIELKSSWRCVKGRGHFWWGVGRCI